MFVNLFLQRVVRSFLMHVPAPVSEYCLGVRNLFCYFLFLHLPLLHAISQHRWVMEAAPPEEAPAALEVEAPQGPIQRACGSKGNYCYWATAADPKDETLERLGVKRPCEFSRQSFREVVVAARAACGIDVVRFSKEVATTTRLEKPPVLHWL